MTTESLKRSERLEPNAQITIVKLKPDGSVAIRYPGEIIDTPTGWVGARAPWQQPRIDLGYLIFEPGDIFLEYFSLEEFFNVFAIHTVAGNLKGWYCNVTHPSWVEDHFIYWHDLYIDVVAYPDGKFMVLDEDELADSGLELEDPALYQRILSARDRLLDLVERREYPFDQKLTQSL